VVQLVSGGQGDTMEEAKIALLGNDSEVQEEPAESIEVRPPSILML
jgi:hypothetical protein